MILDFLFKKKKNIQNKIKTKFEMNDWMELSREERLKKDLQEKNERMINKKALLKSIREEYSKIKNK